VAASCINRETTTARLRVLVEVLNRPFGQWAETRGSD
jgi:hypothetical protein